VILNNLINGKSYAIGTGVKGEKKMKAESIPGWNDPCLPLAGAGSTWAMRVPAVIDTYKTQKSSFFI